MNTEYKYGEMPYAVGDTIKKTKGWRVEKRDFWDWDIDFSLFGCSTNWCMGSVITSGWEFYLDLGKYSISYLNRVEIKPPKELTSKF